MACSHRSFVASLPVAAARRPLVARTAAPSIEPRVSAPDAISGPVLGRDFHAPHCVPEEAIPRIVSMLQHGSLFRYGGNNEGSMQARAWRGLSQC